ncbi:MAG: DUF362 domain-containing protein [Candidatus Latescibacteria bacterium]|jgi:uncharacterized protein (DUF362 family)|nr:DUF362 domain-containing protein [Candidatus Latescibacterota bacterium]
MNRRTFLKSTALGSSAALASSKPGLSQIQDVSLQNTKTLSKGALRIEDGVKLFLKNNEGNTTPSLREEIQENPDAVFIIMAGINVSRDENGVWNHCHDQIERFGKRVGQLVFRKGSKRGIGTFIKPNFVSGFRGEDALFQSHGGRVHPFFVAGLADALHEIGNSNIIAGARGGMSHEQFTKSGCKDLFNTMNMPLIEANIQPFSGYHRRELIWHKNHKGLVAQRFCTYKPAFYKDTTFINIAHAHTHKVGHTTLTIKNIQGIMPRGYGHICDSWTSMDLWRRQFRKDFNPDYRVEIEKQYVRHANMGYKHWDDGGFYKTYRASGGYEAFIETLRMFEISRGEKRNRAREKLYSIADSRIFWAEQWAQRIMDCIEVMPPPDINMVEGVFGRGYNTGVMHTDFLTTGKSMVAVDAVTSWLMGHDPRELPYLRIAKERGIGENDIEKISIFLLDENGPFKIKDYRDLPRHFLGINNNNIKELGPRFF